MSTYPTRDQPQIKLGTSHVILSDFSSFSTNKGQTRVLRIELCSLSNQNRMIHMMVYKLKFNLSYSLYDLILYSHII